MYLAHNLFGADLMEVLSANSSQIMDTCHGEKRIKVSRPYPEINISE